MGAERVLLLDGGLRAWVDAGYATEGGPVTRTPVVFNTTFHGEVVRSFDEVQAIVGDDARGEQILDARSAGRFTGTAPEPRASISSGHMPGSINVPFTELVRDGRLKDAAALREVFTTRGVDLTRPITTSCGSGVTAAVLAFGLERCGVSPVRLYDGSWAEYAERPDAQIEKG